MQLELYTEDLEEKFKSNFQNKVRTMFKAKCFPVSKAQGYNADKSTVSTQSLTLYRVTYPLFKSILW